MIRRAARSTPRRVGRYLLTLDPPRRIVLTRPFNRGVLAQYLASWAVFVVFCGFLGWLFGGTPWGRGSALVMGALTLAPMIRQGSLRWGAHRSVIDLERRRAETRREGGRDTLDLDRAGHLELEALTERRGQTAPGTPYHRCRLVLVGGGQRLCLAETDDNLDPEPPRAQLIAVAHEIGQALALPVRVAPSS